MTFFIGKFVKWLSIVAIVTEIFVVAATSLEMVETTGRAIFQTEVEKDKARMLALEEALYLAALSGGAKIDGYSSITTNSAISDNFVIRPASNIVDYTIIDESAAQEHYSVTIIAAVGSVESKGCMYNSIVNLTSFMPKILISSKVPAWFQVEAKRVYTGLMEKFQENSNINLINAESELLDIHKLNSINDQFDYTSLTVGRTRIEVGNYALFTQIEINNKKSFKQDLIEAETDFVVVELVSKIFEGENYAPIFTQTDTITIPIRTQGVSRIINILSTPSKDSIRAEIDSFIPGHIDNIVKTLSCQPLTAKLNVVGDRLKIKLGGNHGLKKSSIAIAEGDITPWTLLRVTELGPNYTFLETLDSKKDLRKMNGLKIKFLEEM